MRGRSGFTFVELLVVIAILAILGAMVLPLVIQSKIATKRIACIGNLRQLGSAMKLYQQDFAGCYPSTDSYPGEPIGGSSWVIWISPYLKSKTVLNCPAASAPWTVVHEAKQLKIGYAYNEYINYRYHRFTTENAMRMPSQVLLLADGYLESLMHDWDDGSFLDQIDGLPGGMNRIRFADVRQTNGRQIPLVRHGGPNVMFCDGHTRRISVTSFAAVNYPGYSHPGSCREWPLMYPGAKRFIPITSPRSAGLSCSGN